MKGDGFRYSATAVVAATLFPIVVAAQSIAFTPFTFDGGNGASAAADSARLTVPMHRPNSGTVSLALVRFRAIDTSLHHTPIVYLSGGSGAGISAARGSRFPFFQALRNSRDVITFDLRGAGRSTPALRCQHDAPIPLDAPLGYPDVVALLRDNAHRCAVELRASGIDPSGFNLRETVEDIEAIRIALGAPAISIVGISTGSQIGLEYIRRHPTHVSRAVIAGVQGPGATIDLPADQETVLRELESSAGVNGLVATMKRVLDTLGARRVVVNVRGANGTTTPVSLGRFDAQLLASATLGDRRQMALLPVVFGAAARGNFTPLAQFKVQASQGGINSAVEALQDCQSGVDAARRVAREKAARTAMLGWGTLDFPEHCDGWGVKPLDESWRGPVHSAVPVLLISGTLDGRTSVANARAVMRGLSNGVHLVVGGASHGDDLFLSSPKIVDVIGGFLLGADPRELRVDVPNGVSGGAR